jgi:hypothetical protein
MRLGYIVLIFTGTLFLGHERLHAQDRSEKSGDAAPVLTLPTADR